MALSEKWVLEKARALLWDPRYTGFNPVAFTRVIEAEVRKQDTELIRQMLEALEDAHALLQEVAACFTRDDDLPDNLLPRIDAMLAASKQGGA